MPAWIQSTPVGSGNRGEEEVYHFLDLLPADFMVFRELHIAEPIARKWLRPKRPDFVVVSPRTGLLCLEVKGWDPARSMIEWPDQYHVRFTYKDGSTEERPNPERQAEMYRDLFKDILDGFGAPIETVVILSLIHI